MVKNKKHADDFWEKVDGWKSVDVGDALLLGCAEDGFMGLEELDPATLGDFIIDGNVEPAKDEPQEPKQAAKKRKEKPPSVEKELKEKTAKKQKAKKPKATNSNDEAQQADEPVDMFAWSDFQLNSDIIGALEKLKFSAPTHVQCECLPAAIRDGRDIIGAAQTGSGKTLAFGLPIMQLLAAEKQNGTEDRGLKALILAPTRELAMQVSNHLKAIGEACGIWTVPIVGGISKQKQERLLSKNPQIVVATPGRLWDLMKEGSKHVHDLSKLSFLVIDEADRMVQQGHYSELSNILDSIPQTAAVDSTKNQDEDNTSSESDDEDVEVVRKKQNTMQTFVFSATLTLPPQLRKRLKKGGGGSSGSASLDSLLERLPFRVSGGLQPKIVDLTSERKLADKVEEFHIQCPEAERDEYLYYILSTYPGRAIIFVNAISSVRRLAAVLKVLKLPVAALHAGMQQRQRLKALDRFKENENGILIATDVAARGLDIKDVRRVIHYQLPASLDVYVHRSGRTARAEAEGTAIALVTPKENGRYAALLRALKQEESPELAVDMAVMRAVRRRIALAVKLDGLLRTESKGKAERTWRQQQAEQLDILISDEDSSEDEALVTRKTTKKGESAANASQAASIQNQLAALLAEPLKETFETLKQKNDTAMAVKKKTSSKKANKPAGGVQKKAQPVNRAEALANEVKKRKAKKAEKMTNKRGLFVLRPDITQSKS